jgi:hypothetical protein
MLRSFVWSACFFSFTIESRICSSHSRHDFFSPGMASSLAEVRDQLVGGAEESRVMASYG